MADNSNNGSGYVNFNICRSFNQNISTTLTMLTGAAIPAFTEEVTEGRVTYAPMLLLVVSLVLKLLLLTKHQITLLFTTWDTKMILMALFLVLVRVSHYVVLLTLLKYLLKLFQQATSTTEHSFTVLTLLVNKKPSFYT